jgi:hypothetical protein
VDRIAGAGQEESIGRLFLRLQSKKDPTYELPKEDTPLSRQPIAPEFAFRPPDLFRSRGPGGGTL